MSFYDEVVEKYKIDLDPETGLLSSEQKVLDELVQDAKRGIVFAAKHGNTHTELRYDNIIRDNLHLSSIMVKSMATCSLLYGCLYDEKYAKAWKLVLAELGPEFCVEVHHDKPSRPTDKYRITITWLMPNEVTP